MEGFLWIIIVGGIVWIVISRPNKTDFVSFGFQSFGKTKAGGRRAIVEDIRAFEHKNNLHRWPYFSISPTKINGGLRPRHALACC